MSDHLSERIVAAVRSLPFFRGLPAGERESFERIATLKDGAW